jgi:selenocysteine-specific elongation factor
VTIAGGTVLDIAPPRMNRAGAAARLRALDGGSTKDRIALFVRESGYGVSVSGLVTKTGLLAREIESAIRSDAFIFLKSPQPWIVERAAFEAVKDRLKKALAAFHRQNPLQPGMPKEELRSRELPEAPAFFFDAVLTAATDIVAEGETEAAVAKIERAFAGAGLAVPSTAEVLAKCGVEPARARSLLQILLRDKRLVRVSEDLVFHDSAMQQLRHMLAQHKGQQFAVGTFKDWTGVSRKYAIPLLEYLDRERVTRRTGDSRVVL